VTFEKRISADSDDAEESSDGGVDNGSSDLELMRDGSDVQQVGLRWTGVTIPVGATITNAYVQFTVDESGSVPITLKVQGQLHGTNNPATFNESDNNISNRARTFASITWTPPGWPTADVSTSLHRTSPSLAAVIQEIVDAPGWSGNNPLVLIITEVSGTGKRVADSRDGNSSGAALLHVEYTP
jgi:hypothetical protein